jgi:asparaginyl-tRNA synthetase
MLIKEIYKQWPTIKDTKITFSGWVRTIRNSQKDGLSFCEVFDGSHTNTVQIVISPDKTDTSKFPDFYSKCNTGAAVTVSGQIIESPAQGQLFEVIPYDFIVHGITEDLDTYPIAKKKINMDTLRLYPHLRTRTPSLSCVMRIRSRLSQATHMFFDEQDFLHLDPNIITANECESGAGVFTVTELDLDKHEKIPRKKLDDDTTIVDFSKDHFRKRAFLTVSSQLQLEALAQSMGRVYTTNKSFRSEHSLTSKHVSEFTHLEIEVPFIQIQYLMDIGEKYVKQMCQIIIEKCSDEIDFLMKRQCPDLKDRLTKLIESPFVKLTHRECVKHMFESEHTFEESPGYDKDLSSEHEQWLTKKFGPIFVTHWPFSLKSFYMKRCDDDTCEAFDLLLPYVGELIGGSMREQQLDVLLRSMDEKGVSAEPLEFYTDLRKYGTCEHGGFGLGMDRLLVFLTGMSSIKDVIPFPVSYTSCKC